MEQKQKESNSKIKAIKIKCLRAIKKREEDRRRNTDMRLELRVDEIKNPIQKSRLSWDNGFSVTKQEFEPK